MLLVFITNNVWREHRRRFSWFYFTVSSRTFFFPLWLILFNSQNSRGNLSTVVGHTKVTSVERVFTGSYVHARIYLYSIYVILLLHCIFDIGTHEVHVGLTISKLSAHNILLVLYYVVFIFTVTIAVVHSKLWIYRMRLNHSFIFSNRRTVWNTFSKILCCAAMLYSHSRILYYTIICITATRNWSASSQDYYNITLLYTDIVFHAAVVIAFPIESLYFIILFSLARPHFKYNIIIAITYCEQKRTPSWPHLRRGDRHHRDISGPEIFASYKRSSSRSVVV